MAAKTVRVDKLLPVMPLPLWFTLLAASVACLLMGGIALRIALKGRRVDDTPLCAECGFDQTGRPADSVRCSECGADLSGPAAIALGHRRTRRGLAIVAGIVLFAALTSVALTIVTADRVDFRPILPLAWLEYRARTASPSAATYAMGEIRERWRTHRLSAAQRQHLIETALEIQADQTQPWLQAWGELIESAHAAGDLMPAQWKQYAEHVAPVFATTVRAKVAHDAYLPYSLNFQSARAGDGGLWLRMPNQARRIWIDDQPLPPPEATQTGGIGFTLSARGGALISSGVDLPAAFRTTGKHHLLVRQRVIFTDPDGMIRTHRPPPTRPRSTWNGPAILSYCRLAFTPPRSSPTPRPSRSFARRSTSTRSSCSPRGRRADRRVTRQFTFTPARPCPSMSVSM